MNKEAESKQAISVGNFYLIVEKKAHDEALAKPENAPVSFSFSCALDVGGTAVTRHDDLCWYYFRIHQRYAGT